MLMYKDFYPVAYDEGYAYGLNPQGKYGAGYTGASLGEGDDPVSPRAQAYTAYCEGYCAALHDNPAALAQAKADAPRKYSRLAIGHSLSTSVPHSRA